MAMTLEQQRALAMAKARLRLQQQESGSLEYQKAPQEPPDPGLVGHFLSGTNQGLANFLSLPNTVEIGLRSIGPAIGNAMGGDFEMPTMEDSAFPNVGASYSRLVDSLGASRPPPAEDDMWGKAAYRVGEEFGASALPGGALATRAAAPVRMAVTETAAALGSGTGAAIANEIAPDNAAAEILGQLAGGLAPLSFSNQASRAAARVEAPSLDELEAAKRAMYQQADNLGVRYTPQAMDDLIARLEGAAAANTLVPARHQKAASVLGDFQNYAGHAPTLSELDALRQVVNRDLMKSSEGSDRFFGRLFLNEIDDFIARATSADVISGDPVAAATIINQARELNQRFRRTEAFETAMRKADLNAASSGSGGNINNAIRQQAKSLVLNPNKARQFSPEQLELIEQLSRQGTTERLLRGVGKVAPGGNGLMTALNIGAVAHNPAMAAVPITGTIAKALADGGTVKQSQVLRALIARGGPDNVPRIMPQTEQAAAGVMAGQAANQELSPRQAVMLSLMEQY